MHKFLILIFNPIPIREAKVEIETHQVTTEVKISKCCI